MTTKTKTARPRTTKVSVAIEQDSALLAERDALLEALVLLVASIENNVGPTFLPLQRARAVIAKAEENT